MKEKSIAYPVIFMTALTALTVLLLAFLNVSTADKVAENQALELQRKILYVFDLYDPATTSDEDVKTIFEEKVEKKDGEIYALVEDGQDKAYAVPFNGPGLWGSIRGYIGVDSEMKSVTGVEFIEQNETPGLGGRISEAPYKEQYRGVDISQATDNYIINRPANGGNIDAVTGATQTSTFVQNMINEDLKAFSEKGVN